MDIIGIILTILSTITMSLSLIAVTLIHLVVYLVPILFLYWCLPTLWQKMDSWLDDFKEYRAKMIGKKPELVRWDADNFTKERKEKLAWAKKHPILHAIKESWWWLKAVFWYRVPDYPYDIKWHIKRSYQRAKRGWADSDTWGYSSFLAEVIRDGCKHLDKTKHGIPNSVFPEITENRNHTDEEFAEAEKLWDEVLQKIIKTFDTAKNISEYHWLYQKSDKYSQKLAAEHLAMNKKFIEEDPVLWEDEKLHVMTLQECKDYEEGWALFQEHFFGLWD